MTPRTRNASQFVKGNEIPLAARILAVADAFDAMTSERPYRLAMSRKEALDEIKRCNGTQFDPIVVAAFFKTDMAKTDIAEPATTKTLSLAETRGPDTDGRNK